MELRDTARESARVSDLEADWSEYRRRRNHCTKLQRSDKNAFLRDTFTRLETNNDTAAIFATARDLLGTVKAGPPTSFLQDGQVIRKQKDIANVQMKYYLDKVTAVKASLPRVRNNPLGTLQKLFARWRPLGRKPKFSLKSVTTVEILKIIKKT